MMSSSSSSSSEASNSHSKNSENNSKKLSPPDWVLQVPGVDKWLEKSRGIVEAEVDTDSKTVVIGDRKSQCDLQLLGSYKTSIGVWYWGWIVDLADRSLVNGLSPIQKGSKKLVASLETSNPKLAERVEFLLQSGYSAVSPPTVLAMACIGAQQLGAEGVLVASAPDGSQDIFLLIRELSVE